MKLPLFLPLILLSFVFSKPVFSNDGDEAQISNTPYYLTVEPDIVTNMPGRSKRSVYLSLTIDLMVRSKDDLVFIQQHAPLIRSVIIETISLQDPNALKKARSRPSIQKELLDQINAELLPLAGRVVLSNLLFIKYLYQ